MEEIEEVIDEAPSRGRIDWNRVRQTVALHHESERQANRRRGQQTFNEMIKAGRPYSEALKEAASAGMFFDNSEAHTRAFENLAQMESKQTEPVRPVYRTVRGVGLGTVTENGFNVIQPEVKAPPKPQGPRAMTIPERERMKSELAEIEENKDFRESGSNAIWGSGVKPDRRGVERAKVYNKYDALIAPPDAAPVTAPEVAASTNSTVTTKAQFDALAPGAIYIGKDGRRRQKP